MEPLEAQKVWISSGRWLSSDKGNKTAAWPMMETLKWLGWRPGSAGGDSTPLTMTSQPDNGGKDLLVAWVVARSRGWDGLAPAGVDVDTLQPSLCCRGAGTGWVLATPTQGAGMGTGIGWTRAALSLKTGTSVGSGLVSCEAPSRAMISEEEGNATLTIAGGACTHALWTVSEWTD